MGCCVVPTPNQFWFYGITELVLYCEHHALWIRIMHQKYIHILLLSPPSSLLESQYGQCYCLSQKTNPIFWHFEKSLEIYGFIHSKTKEKNKEHILYECISSLKNQSSVTHLETFNISIIISKIYVWFFLLNYNQCGLSITKLWQDEGFTDGNLHSVVTVICSFDPTVDIPNPQFDDNNTHYRSCTMEIICCIVY